MSSTPDIRISRSDDDEPQYKYRLKRLEDKVEKHGERIEKLEHYKTFLVGLSAAFGFCGAFIGYLLKTYVFK